MVGFGMILGAAASGWSNAELDEIKEQRKARLEELDRQYKADEAEKDRQFRKTEGQTDREAQRKNLMDQQSFTASENEKNRASNADLLTTDEGDSVVRSGDKVKPLTDEEGNKVRLAATSKDKPAEVSTAEWLVQNGVAKDAKDAWRLVRGARTDPEKSRAAIYKAHLALLKPELGARPEDGAAIQKEAMRLTDEVMKQLDEADAAEESGSAVPATAGEPAAASAPATKTQDTEEVVTPANVVPSDPAKRVVGKIYLNKQGQKARWTGKGWEPVK